MKLLFLGMPGVGKGTYAQVLEKELGIPHISSGDILRAEVEKGSFLGTRANEYMLDGKLVPDDIIMKMIENRITKIDCAKGFILDGFPRTKAQAVMLKELVDITHVLHFKADDLVIIERLSGRIVCKDCKKIFHKQGNRPKQMGICDECGGELRQREDDQPHIIKKRLDEDREKSRPLISHYKDQGILVEVVINKPMNEIQEKLVARVKDFLAGKITHIGELR